MKKTSLRQFFEEHQETLDVPAQTLLYQEGTSADKLFYLHQGSLVSYKSDKIDKGLAPNFIKSGHVLGLNALRGKIYQNTVQTLEDSLLGYIHLSFVNEAIKQNIQLRMVILQELCKEVNRVEDKILHMHRKSIRQRITYLLLDMLRTYGLNPANQINLSVAWPQLAHLVGINEKTLAKTLQDLRTEGLIQEQNGRIVVLDQAKMEAIV